MFFFSDIDCLYVCDQHQSVIQNIEKSVLCLLEDCEDGKFRSICRLSLDYRLASQGSVKVWKMTFTNLELSKNIENVGMDYSNPDVIHVWYINIYSYLHEWLIVMGFHVGKYTIVPWYLYGFLVAPFRTERTDSLTETRRPKTQSSPDPYLRLLIGTRHLWPLRRSSWMGSISEVIWCFPSSNKIQHFDNTSLIFVEQTNIKMQFRTFLLQRIFKFIPGSAKVFSKIIVLAVHLQLEELQNRIWGDSILGKQ